FFFQAEDGIRDRNVTGVQTCALPIYDRFQRSLDRVFQVVEGVSDDQVYNQLVQEANEMAVLLPTVRQLCCAAHRMTPSNDDTIQIGRASCRERGWGAERGKRLHGRGQ